MNTKDDVGLVMIMLFSTMVCLFGGLVYGWSVSYAWIFITGMWLVTFRNAVESIQPKNSIDKNANEYGRLVINGSIVVLIALAIAVPKGIPIFLISWLPLAVIGIVMDYIDQWVVEEKINKRRRKLEEAKTLLEVKIYLLKKIIKQRMEK